MGRFAYFCAILALRRHLPGVVFMNRANTDKPSLIQAGKGRKRFIGGSGVLFAD
jgi:hypothetical protein